MLTTMESCEGEVVTLAGRREETRSCITTTLYELMTALQAVVAPEDDAVVVATVMHLLRSGRLTFALPPAERG